MDNLEPITRNEMFLNGDDLEPITREEMILAGADLEPLTRHEWFLKKYRGSGDVTIERLAVTENGTYSESGKAYSPVVVNVPTPPVPENAYLLNSLSGLPADIASFNDGTDLPMASLKVAVTPYQDLHGYDAPWAGGAGKNKCPTADGTTNENGQLLLADVGTVVAGNTYTLSLKALESNAKEVRVQLNSSTEIRFNAGSLVVGQRASVTFTASTSGTVSIGTNVNAFSASTKVIEQIQLELGSTATTFAPYSNICPISGWDEAVVTVADDAESPTTSHEYTIDLDGTRYGGTLDATNGTMIVDRAYVDLGTLSWGNASDGRVYSSAIADIKPITASATVSNIMCSNYATVSARAVYDKTTNGSICIAGAGYGGDKCIGVYDLSLANKSASEVTQAMSGVQLVYELATPITVQLSPQPVKSLEGTNNIFADCGQITEVKYFKKA